MSAPVYVVVTTKGGMARESNKQGGPIVMETEVEGSTLEQAQHHAARLERRFGACRVARLVFEDDPAFHLPHQP